jgi:hypothetical protein
LTHCTGMRNGLAWSVSMPTSTVSRCSISVGPLYQGIILDCDAMLSPLKPEIGMGVKAVMPIFREGAVVGDDRVELRLIIADQVHLVHRQHDVADADQVREIGVAPRLGQHALARVDQDHREVGGRGAGHHVAGILLVAGVSATMNLRFSVEKKR